ncbi:MAG: hypothetical protein WCX64_05655 [Candidatus Micrarchaeia archaeon]
MPYLRGQGATEYLVVIGAVLLVSLFVVNSVITTSQTGASMQEQQSLTYWKTATPFSITSYTLNSGTLVVSVTNQYTTPLKLTAVQVNDNGTPITIWSGSRVFAAAEQATLYLHYGAGNDCKNANVGDAFEVTQLTFIYDKSDGLQAFSQVGTEPLSGRCKENGGISFVPPTPADGTSASAGANVTINATINGSAATQLAGLGLSWNGTNTLFYDNSLVLCYNFDNNAGIGDNATTAVDVSTYGNNGTISGASWTAAGKYGSALSFDGSSDRVTVPDSQGIDPTGGITVAAWVQANDNRQNTILSKGSYTLAIGSDGLPYFEIAGGEETFTSLPAPGVNAYAFATVNGSTYSAGYDNGSVMRYDGGTTWTGVGYPSNSSYAITAFNRTIFAAGYNGTVYRYDGGTAWTSLGNANGTVYGLIGFNNTLYAGLYTDTSSKVMRYDGGTTWTVTGNLA